VADISAALSGTYAGIRSHKTLIPLNGVNQQGSGRVACGVDAALGKVWSFNSGGLYQVDALTSAAWTALTLPTNVTPSGAEAEVVTFTPLTGANAGTKLMFLTSWNTSTSRYEIYSAAPGLKSVTPTWSSVLHQLPVNATAISTAFRACSTGLFVGTYSGTTDLTNAIVYRSVDGITFTAVLTLPAGSGATRHIHGIYEDPYNLGTIYVTIGDAFSPYSPPYLLYKSTDGGATFTGVSTVTVGTWQGVAMGFRSDGILLCSDQVTGAGPVFLDRATLTPRWYTTHPRQDRIAVPGGVGGRYVTDAAFTSGSATITSATAAFTSLDVGRFIQGNNSIPIGTYIASVTNATTVVLSANASNTLSSQTILIAGDTYYSNAYAGAVDPATGWLYIVANDSSSAGTTAGVFRITGPDQPLVLLWTLPKAALGHYECYIAGGYLWIDRYGPFTLPTGVTQPA
jgi:hypothetical protein